MTPTEKRTTIDYKDGCAICGQKMTVPSWYVCNKEECRKKYNAIKSAEQKERRESAIIKTVL